MTTAKEAARLATAEQAAEWYLRHREGALDADGRQAFEAWVSESPQHVEHYLGIARLVALFPEVSDDPHFDVEALVRRAQADKVVDFDAGVAGSGSKARREIPRHDFYGRLGWVAASLLILVGGLAWWNWWQGRITDFAYATEHGVVKTFALPDRSLLQLDSDSRVTFRYGRNVRQVDLLRGQAYLEVTPDPGRPFEVLVGAIHIRDVGTHFDVYRKEPLVKVTVLEGAVSVASTAAAVIARAGQQATVPLGGGAVTVQDVDVGAAIAWRSGRLVFRDRPLAEVVDEFNRYSQVRIEIDSPGLGIMPVSGVISVQDTTSLMAFLNNLPGIKVTASSGYISVAR